jgi:hypothetical protein
LSGGAPEQRPQRLDAARMRCSGCGDRDSLSRDLVRNTQLFGSGRRGAVAADTAALRGGGGSAGGQ